MSQNLPLKHFKEKSEFKKLQKKEWSLLLTGQQKRLATEPSVVNKAYEFEKERDEHNKKFREEEKEMNRRHQKELEDWKGSQELGDGEPELV